MARKDRDEMAAIVERLAMDRGGKVMGVKVPDVAAPVVAVAPVANEPAGDGTLIVAFEVDKRPIPWKAATVLKRGGAFKDKNLLAWQAEVRRCGKEAMAGREPYAGPVELRFLFSLIRKAGSAPDLSNVVKSTEDSLQGEVIVNDRAVMAIASRRTFGDRDFARVEVRVFDPK